MGPALADERGLARAGERRRVDQTNTLGQGVEAQAGPGQVEERQRGDDVHLHSVVGPQQHHGPLRHEGRPGHGVGDGASFPGCRLFLGCCHELVDDGGVHLVERVRGLVEVVEAAGRTERRRGGMARRAQVDPSRPRHRLHHAGAEQLRTGGPEAHHGDAGAPGSHDELSRPRGWSRSRPRWNWPSGSRRPRARERTA